ncbi:MAG: DUF6476 family protein [Pseudomonadota bacterium]
MNAPLDLDDDEFVEPPSLRRLRLLVTVLTSVLIFGMLTMVGVFVIRLGGIGAVPAPSAAIEESIAAEAFNLPVGAKIVAIGRGQGTVLIVTEGPEGEILRTFDAATGAVRSATPIARD